MTNDKRDEVIAQFLETRPRPVTGDIPGLNDEQRAEVQPLLEVAELLWEAGHGAPPLEDDPVAAMLGLVPDPRYTLDREAFTRAWRNAKLKPSLLAERLRARGWEVQTGDVFRWQSQSTADVSPALIKAIAEETGTDPDHLTVSRQESGELEVLSALSRLPQFTSLVQRWMRVQGTSSGLAASTLRSRALATVHRGDRPDAEQLLASLEALVAAMEAEGDQHEPR